PQLSCLFTPRPALRHGPRGRCDRSRVESMSAPVFDPTGLEPRSATDEQRASAPLARTPEGTGVGLGHAEAMEVAGEHGSYSSACSRFLKVPSGLAGVEHPAIRAVTDHFFGPEEMAAFEPVLRDVARDLVEELTADVGSAGTE